MRMLIRQETQSDAPVIARVVERAFKNHPYSSGTEAEIIRNLRASSALIVSLVVEKDGLVRGHIAASPVEIDGRIVNWFGIGPVAVEPITQGIGLGSALVNECISELRKLGAAGCVVLGEPEFYGRFGFKSMASLTYPGPPAEHFMALPLGGPVPQGIVNYHAAFTSGA